MEAPTLHDTKLFAAAWRSAELDSTIGDLAVATLDRIDGIRAELTAVRSGAGSGSRNLATQIATGELSVGAAIERERHGSLRVADVNRAIELAGRATNAALQLLAAELRNRQSDVEDAINSAMHRCLIEAAKLAPAVDGIDGDDDAIRSSKGARDAWARLTALHDRLTATGEAVMRLNRLGCPAPIVPGKPAHITSRHWRALAPAQRLVTIATVVDDLEPTAA